MVTLWSGMMTCCSFKERIKQHFDGRIALKRDHCALEVTQDPEALMGRNKDAVSEFLSAIGSLHEAGCFGNRFSSSESTF